MIQGVSDDVALLEAEEPDSLEAEDARHLITIYGELLAFHQSRFSRLAAGLGASGVAVADEQVARNHLHHLQERLAFWQERHATLAVISLDRDRRILSSSCGSALLTKREAQLLDFLLQRPDGHHRAPTLAAEAWHEPGLASEQVRTYIVRLRRLLVAVGAPCRINSQRRLGYRLTFSDGRRSPAA